MTDMNKKYRYCIVMAGKYVLSTKIKPCMRFYYSHAMIGRHKIKRFHSRNEAEELIKTRVPEEHWKDFKVIKVKDFLR